MKRTTKKDLTQGATLTITNREGLNIGTATLIRRRPSHYQNDNIPFVLKEKTNAVQDSTTQLWACERWEIEWVKHSYYRKGDRNCTEVCYFVGTRAQYPSFTDDIDTSKRYLILEEEGVVALNGEYISSCIKALKRVNKTFQADIIVYSHTPHKTRENFEINDTGLRIMGFLPTEFSFQEEIIQYLYTKDVEDYLILAGESLVDPTILKNTIQCGPQGLKIKQTKKP